MDKNILIKIEQNLKRIADSLEKNKSESFNNKFNHKSNAFVWDADKNILRSLKKINAIELKLLQGIEHQTNTLYENTINFSNGFMAMVLRCVSHKKHFSTHTHWRVFGSLVVFVAQTR